METITSNVTTPNLTVQVSLTRAWRTRRLGSGALLATTAGDDVIPPSTSCNQADLAQRMFNHDRFGLYDGLAILVPNASQFITYKAPLCGHQLYCKAQPHRTLLITDDPTRCYDNATVHSIDSSTDDLVRTLAALFIGGSLASAFGISIHSSLTTLLGAGTLRTYHLGDPSGTTLLSSRDVEQQELDPATGSYDVMQRRVDLLAANSRGFVVELSGGIDSGIVAHHVARSAGAAQSRAVHVGYPYREFQREAFYLSELQEVIDLPTAIWDGSDLGEYDRVGRPIHSAEPNAGSVGNAAYYDRLVELCAETGARTILTGGGGDLVYCNEGFAGWQEPAMPEAAHWGRRFVRSFRETCQSVLQTDLLARRSAMTRGCALIENPLGNIFFARQGIRFESGFASSRLLHAVAMDRKALEGGLAKRPKELARRIYADRLPASVLNRPGKVNHIGLERRSFLRSIGALRELLGKSDPILRSIDLSPDRVHLMLDNWRKGLVTEDRLWSALIHLCAWRQEFGRRVADRALSRSDPVRVSEIATNA